MEADDGVVAVDVIKGNAEAKQQEAKTRSIWRYPFFTVPLVGWCLFSTFWLWGALPFWLAIPVGCVLGIVLFFLVGQLMASGASTLLELSVGASIGLVLLLPLTPVFREARNKARTKTCMSNVKTLSYALLAYADDNDERLPLGKNWESTSRSFRPAGQEKTVEVLRCPTAVSGTGYALDALIAEKDSDLIAQPETVPMVFDAMVEGANATATLEHLPQPGRHGGGNVVGFADGHIRWVKTLPEAALKEQVRAAK